MMDKNFGHDTFVIVEGRVGTPLNNPELHEPWVVWLGGNEIVVVDEIDNDSWFGEYPAEQNLRNALGALRRRSEVARHAQALFDVLSHG
ncbi:hypothetical protein GF380_00830 [Candidatus Uhrbacteria bacterium]|nr:hypothetical protein [Candidatus Uhrbacteria bacterium]